MLRLRTFGGISLDRDGVPLAVRRHPLALLALLAAHREQGMSRDKVVAYLWPESDAPRARNSLKQDCYSLRHALGGHVVVCPQGTLRLDAALLDVDVWRFEADLAAGLPAAAVARYQGPFLDGFYVPGLDEFERWTEAERNRLAGLYSEALSVLAEAADQTGDRASAIAWWRRLTALDPLSSRAAVGLIRALESSGDATSALDHARRHAATVQAELGAPVPAEVVAFMERLGADPRRPATRWRPPPAPPPWHPRVRDVAATHLEAGLGAVPLVAPTRSVHRLPRSPPWLMALLVGLAVLLAAFWTRWADRGPVPAGPGGSAAVTVLPFAVMGAPTVAGLGEGLEDLLAARLDGADRLRTVPVSSRLDRDLGRAVRLDRQVGAAIARRASARFYVLGRLVGAGDRLQATATLYDRGNANTPAARAEATVAGTDLFELADRLAGQLITGLYRVRDEPATRLTAASTRSVPALKAYLEGERRFRADSVSSAVGAFRRAVRADTAFALAYYRLSVAADWSGRPELALWAARLAARFSEHLSEYDRALVEAYLVQGQGPIEEAERRYRRIVAEYPDGAEAWFQLAEVLFHSNPLRGRSVTEAREALERALLLDPGNAEAVVHLARVAALEGRRGEADSLVRRALAQIPDARMLDLRAVRAFAFGDLPGDQGAIREFLAQPGLIPAETVLGVAVYPEDLERAERLATLLARDPRSCAVRGLGRRMLAQAGVGRGRPRAVTALLREAGPCDSIAALELRAVLGTLSFIPPDTAELATIRLALETRGQAHPADSPAEDGLGPALREYYIGLVALRVSDTSRARRSILTLAGLRDSSNQRGIVENLTRSLRARLALAHGRPAVALRYLEGTRWGRSGESGLAETGDRFLRAELLRELGRDDEAIGWYRSIAQRSFSELVYLAPAELRLAEIDDRRGDRANAREHYTRFLQLWRQPEVALEPMVGVAAGKAGGRDLPKAR